MLFQCSVEISYFCRDLTLKKYNSLDMRNLLSLIMAIVLGTFAFGQTENETLGTGAGVSITTGDYNTLIGDSSGTTLSSGLYNTMVGHKSGFSQTTASDNTFIGWAAGFSTLTGVDNTFIGKEAGYFNTATDGVFVGTRAGFNNTTGTDNTFIGEESGLMNTTGRDNTFVGEDSGYNNTDGRDNTFIGSTAGRTNTTGYQNTAVGNEAGYDLTTSYWNTFVGDSCGTDVGLGVGNTFLGHAAGAATEHADFNTFIGNNAGWDNNRTNSTTNANRNTYLGANTGHTNREGSDNIGIGAFASFDNTNRSRCIFIGTGGDTYAGGIQAGSFSMADNNDVIVIGHQAQNAGQYGITLGHFADMDGTYTVGMGYANRVTNTGGYGVLFGANGYLSKTYSVGVGYGDTITGSRSVGLGAYSYVSADSAVALGADTYSTGQFSTGLGYGTNVSGSRSVAIGAGASTSQDNAMVLGGATVADRVNVGIGTSAPNVYASMTLADTDRGLLINKLTAANETTLAGMIGATEEGLMIYNADEDKIKVWDGTQWIAAGVQDLSLSGNTLSLTDDATTVDLSGYLDNTDAQTISLTGTDLSISNGNTIDLSSIDTDTQLSEAEVDAYVANNGYLTSFTEVDGDPTNELQDISLVGTDLSISNGSTIDLSSLDTDTQLSETEVDAYVANNGYLTSFTEVDGDPTNELQDISLSGTDLSISNGSTIDLSSIDTDTQLTEAEVDAYVANNGYLTSFTEVDGDPTNELQDISLVGTDLTITNGSTIDLSGIDTQLSEAEVIAYVTNNGYITSEVDGDPTNEIQDITLTGSDLTISGGSTIDLSVIDTDTDEQDLTAATLTGTVLLIEIENGASVSVDLSPLLTDLQTQITNLDDRVTYLEGCACQNKVNELDGETEQPILYQNIPNPFNNTSSIKYYIPSYAQSANLVISNEMGQLISNISLNEVGAYGEAYVNAEGLNPGAYYYTLYVNQTKFDTKTMVVE